VVPAIEAVWPGESVNSPCVRNVLLLPKLTSPLLITYERNGAEPPVRCVRPGARIAKGSRSRCRLQYRAEIIVSRAIGHLDSSTGRTQIERPATAVSREIAATKIQPGDGPRDV
jgi:hypothetical protein